MNAMLPQLSPVDRLLLRHALGLGLSLSDTPTRNAYSVFLGDTEIVHSLDSLCARNLMVRGRTLSGGRAALHHAIYHATEAGAAAIGVALPECG